MGLYDLVLSEAAAMTLVEASRSEQRRLGTWFDQLKTDAFRRGDLRESDSQGRIHEILVLGSGL